MDASEHERLAANPLGQPLGIRYLLWLAIGKTLRLPVSELMEAINIQLGAAKRERGNRPAPLSDRERFRLAELGRAIGKPIAALFTWLASPTSLVRWLKRHQERQAQAREEPTAQKGGRPRAGPEKIDAVLTIYRSGIRGLKRIQGELYKLKLPLARSTIRRILDDHGLPPGANRSPGGTWTTFWRNHAPATIGIDFIQVAVGLFGKVTYHFALVGIEHDTRKVHLLGLTEHPNDFWLQNVMRTATEDGAPIANRKHWVHDNDGKFQTLRGILKRIGKRSVSTAIRAPDMNAFIERFIRSAREECLDHIAFITEDHLRRSLVEYIDHYNTERPHQGIGNVPVGPWEATAEGRIVCDSRLGGLLNSFHRAA